MLLVLPTTSVVTCAVAVLFIAPRPSGKPIVRRAIIICPTSLVKNWSNELNKWLDNRVCGLSR